VKSIKYHLAQDKLWGGALQESEEELKIMMQRYTEFVQRLIQQLFPHYADAYTLGNASFRPVEAAGRLQSKRQDDSRLHVDAFPSRPVAGARLLRIFANVNLEGKPRIWHAGEDFDAVARHFLPRIAKPLPFSAWLLRAFRMTKSLRTAYDHYMLQLHDNMKQDDDYQQQVAKEKLIFPAGSVWICFSDQTSHAALSGQGLLEQTLYLPIAKMQRLEKSPLYRLERLLETKLV
jgi:hypothetical protein